MADNHGSSPAAWATVFITVLAFCVGGVALVFEPINWVMFWTGVALVPVALIVGKLLSAMGAGGETDA
ncbi:MAG: hypothetical protein H0W56_13515 [Acidothermales bacterium]|jgi:hypothetical protein|nr:hypothetical protein [Acidothermales bacterium]MDQ3422110.1 hypothetical protein [Actinomycetota bacterium]